MIDSETSAKKANPYRAVWGLLAILIGFAGIAIVRDWVWRDTIPWRENLAVGETEGQREHKLLLVEFSSGFCEPCEQMERTTWADKRVKEALEKFVPVKIDFLKETELDKKYGVEAIPTMMVMDDQGKVVRATTGEMDAEEFLGWVRK
ncbi:MAG TPA: thioredoxin domain-containing protein [Tepidisphaeraceae bacterium]|jgi:thioredoxin-related protein